jgi:hypothetical protein
MQVVRQSIDQFATTFLPTLTAPNPVPTYWWQDPLPGLAGRGIRTFGLFVPDDWLEELAIQGDTTNLHGTMLEQLNEFETWVDRIVVDQKCCIAVVFVHSGPVTSRTDGLPPEYHKKHGSGLSKSMKKGIEGAAFYYDNVLKRIARALEKLDKNSNVHSKAHALVICGHYHVGRVVKQLEGVDVIIDGALVANRNVADSELHTFIDVSYAPKPSNPRLSRLYDGGVLVKFNRLDTSGGVYSVDEVLRTVLWLRK